MYAGWTGDRPGTDCIGCQRALQETQVPQTTHTNNEGGGGVSQKSLDVKALISKGSVYMQLRGKMYNLPTCNHVNGCLLMFVT